MNKNLLLLLLLSFVFFQKNKIQAQDALNSPTYYVENFNKGNVGWNFKQSNTTFRWKRTNKGPKNTYPDGTIIPAGTIDPALKKNNITDYWMILDAFEGAKSAPSGIDAVLISPRYDCSDFNEVYLRVNTMFRRYNDAEQLWIGTSTDSINFQYEEVFKDTKIFQFSDGKFTHYKTEPLSMVLKLDASLAKKNKVWVAFRYKSPAFPVGEGNYSWQIDDIELFDKKPVSMCDLKLYDDACAIPPFRVIPRSQVDSIPFLMDVKNNSLAAKKEVEIQVSVEDMSAKTIVFQDKKTIPNIEADETLKKVVFDKKFLPSSTLKTTYRVVYKAKGACDDEFEKNNSYAYYFDVTDSEVFQKEKNSTRRVSPDPSLFPSNNTSWSCGNHFFVKNGESFEAKEIVYMLDNAEELKGDSLIAELYKWENINNDDEAQLSELQLVAFGKKYCDGSYADNYTYSLPILNTQKQKAILEDNTNYLAVIQYKNIVLKEDITMEILASDTLFYDACLEASILAKKSLYNSVLRIGQEPNFNTNGFETPITPVVRLVLGKKTISGSNDVDENTHFSIFPNPIQDAFQIKMNEQNDLISYEIYNSLGQILVKNKCNSNEKINANGLSSGIYFVKIDNRVVKMVKK